MGHCCRSGDLRDFELGHEMELSELKSQWNRVLDEVERVNRIAWLAYFDARLETLKDETLYLDFSDPAKLAGGHDFTKARKAEHRQTLESAIKSVTGHSIKIVER